MRSSVDQSEQKAVLMLLGYKIYKKKIRYKSDPCQVLPWPCAFTFCPQTSSSYPVGLSLQYSFCGNCCAVCVRQTLNPVVCRLYYDVSLSHTL